MNICKWSTLALVTLFLATLIEFASGILCYHCSKDPEVDTCNGFKKEPTEYPPGSDVCYRREKSPGHFNLGSSSSKRVKVMGCKKYSENSEAIECHCNTDGCNKRDSSNWANFATKVKSSPLIIFGLTMTTLISKLTSITALTMFLLSLCHVKNIGGKEMGNLYGHKVADVLSTNADPKTNWGHYKNGSFAYCPKEMYVTHFKAWDTLPGRINGIMQVAVLCSDRKKNKTIWIESGEANYDDTFISPKIGCDNGLAIGLDMSAQMEIGKGGNDAGMLGFALYCSDDEGQFPRRYPGSLSGGSWMSPDKKQICLKGSVLCGIRTQVDDEYTGTGVNNIEMPCCSYDEECTRVEEWKVVFEYNNTHGKENVYDKFTKRLGTSRSKNTNTGVSNSEESGWFIGVKASGSASAEAGIKFKGKAMGQDVKGGAHAEAKGEVEASGGYSNTKKSEYNWEQATSEVFAEETQRESAMVVPAGHSTVLKQIVGTCGSLVVHTDKFMKIDTDKDGKETVEVTGEGVRLQGQLMAVSISFLLIAFWIS